MFRKVVALLLVLVMLGSVVTPVMAASNEQSPCKKCNSCSANIKHKDVAVLEVKGLERDKNLAKALNDKNLKELMDKLIKNGHKPNLMNSVVKRIISKHE